MTTSETISIPCAKIRLLEDKIVFLSYEPDYEVELEDVKEVEKVFIDFDLCQGIYCLMDSKGKFTKISKDAQKFLAKDASIVSENILKASAVVLDTLPSRILAKFFLNFYKPKYHMKIFSNQEDAKKWLISLMQ